MTTAGAFIIKELGGERRVVDLVGRALPYRPYSLRTEQRVELTWLPGAPEATSTVLGAKEGDTMLSGMWKTKYLNVVGTGKQPPFVVNNEPMFSVFEAVDVMESIVRQGQLVEVTWLTQRRVGHLAAFEANWEDHEDAAWSMDFKWVSRGEIPGAAVFIGDQTSTDTIGIMRTAFDAIDDIELPNFGLSLDFLDAYRDFINGLNALVLDMEVAVVNFTRKVLSPIQLTRGLVASLTSIEEEAQLLLDFFDASVDDAINGSNPIGHQAYSEKMSAAQYKAANRAWAHSMKKKATQSKGKLNQQTEGNLAGTYKARAGEDLRDVSKLYYNTPFEWRRIMLFNNFDNAELTAGQTVLVPKFNADRSSQLVIGA